MSEISYKEHFQNMFSSLPCVTNTVQLFAHRFSSDFSWEFSLGIYSTILIKTKFKIFYSEREKNP